MSKKLYCSQKTHTLAQLCLVFKNKPDFQIERRWSEAAYFMIAVTFTSNPAPQPSHADKTALSPSVLPAVYSHDTSSSFVVCLSLPDSFSFLTATGLSFICKYSYVIGKKRKKKEKQFFFLSQNKHCPQSGWLPPSVSDSALLIGQGLQREQCLLSPITG